MNPKLNQYVMVAEVAEALGVPQGTVEAGKIPMHKKHPTATGCSSEPN